MAWFGSDPALTTPTPGPAKSRTGAPLAPGFAGPHANQNPANPLNPAPDPLSTIAAQSAAMLAAADAAARQRRRAMGGNTLIAGNPIGPGINPGAPTLAPRSLVGTP